MPHGGQPARLGRGLEAPFRRARRGRRRDRRRPLRSAARLRSFRKVHGGRPDRARRIAACSRQHLARRSSSPERLPRGRGSGPSCRITSSPVSIAPVAGGLIRLRRDADRHVARLWLHEGHERHHPAIDRPSDHRQDSTIDARGSAFRNSMMLCLFYEEAGLQVQEAAI